MLGKRTRRGPVTKAVGIVAWVTANHSDKGEEEDDEKKQHLAERKPELGLTEPPDRADVDETKVEELE